MSEPLIAPVPAPAPSWYAGADAEIVGHIQTKGWHDKPPEVAALEAIKAHREAEKLIGHPADSLLKFPKDSTDEEGWKNVWGRLGVPKEAKDYDFSSVKFEDGSVPATDFVDWLRTNAHAMNIPKDAAANFGQALVKYMESSGTADAVERTAKLAEEHATLDKSWGANKEANTFIARQAAAKLGIAPEAVTALEGQVGYAAVMNMFLTVGQKIGEDRYVANGGGVNGGLLTREQAVARKAELKADPGWVKKYLHGDAVAGREMAGIEAIIFGGTSARAG